MADISKIRLNGTNYNVKDTTSRNRITRLDARRDRNVILIGDSYVQGVGGGGTTIESVIEGLTGWNVSSFYAGGAGFIRANVDNKKFIDCVQDAIDNTANPDDITDFVFAGSVYNELGMIGQGSFSRAGFLTAVTACITLAKGTFNYCNFYVIPALWVGGTYNDNFKEVANWITMAADANGAGYVTNAIDWLMLETGVDSGDAVHPNATGYTIIGSRIAAVMNGATPSLLEDIQSITPATTGAGSGCRVFAHDAHVHIRATLVKAAGDSFNNALVLPAYTKNLQNVPLVAVRYGTNEAIHGMILQNGEVYMPSSWFTDGAIYIIDACLPLIEGFF